MSSDPAGLDSVRLKLNRAEKHLDSIASLVAPFNSIECKVVMEKQFDVDVPTLRLPALPEDLPLVVGDCLYNLRSALDHLVHALASIGNKTPPTTIQFPICSSPQNYAIQVGKRGRLDGVPMKAQALIKSLQPHNRGNNPLSVLNYLHNIDKHRALNLTVAITEGYELTWSVGGQSFFVSSVVGINFRDGASIEPFLRTMKSWMSHMEVSGQAPGFVAFKESWPASYGFPDPLHVLPTVQEIHQFIRDSVLPGFEPFFH